MARTPSKADVFDRAGVLRSKGILVHCGARWRVNREGRFIPIGTDGQEIRLAPVAA